MSPPPPGTRLVIAGLGGQGVVFATRLVAQAAIGLGWPVIAAETHGMSQRGGSVLSHVKLGPYPSSLIRRGTAHLLIGLEPHEAVRAVPILAPAGACVVNDEQGFGDLAAELERSRIRLHAVPATSLAVACGSAALVNTVLVACAAALGWLPIPVGALRDVLEEIAASRRGPNLAALEAGVEAAGLAIRAT